MATIKLSSGRRLEDVLTGALFTPRINALVKSMRASIVKSANVEDSYEDHMAKVRPFLIAGSGCSDPEPVDASGSGMPSSPSAPRHWCDVIATFPDYGIVSCNSEDKAWKVPYEMDGDTPETGEPEEVTQTWVPEETDGEGTEAE